MEKTSKGKILVYGMREKSRPADAIVVNVTSKSKEDWSQKFSPFLLGPVDVMPFDTKIEAKNMENAWQFLKVYPNHEDKEKYLKWAHEGFASKKAFRFPMGKGKKPLYSLWKGQKLGYLEARKKIYAPLYAECVERYAGDSLEYLRDLYEKGKTIVLLDFDGYSKYSNLKEVLNNPRRKMGHAFVIAMMILNERHWEESK